MFYHSAIQRSMPAPKPMNVSFHLVSSVRDDNQEIAHANDRVQAGPNPKSRACQASLRHYLRYYLRHTPRHISLRLHICCVVEIK